jgi:hypothetical protein
VTLCRLCVCAWERVQLTRCALLLARGSSVGELDALIQDLWVLRYQTLDTHGMGVLN